jgi:hypothetical protein
MGHVQLVLTRVVVEGEVPKLWLDLKVRVLVYLVSFVDPEQIRDVSPGFSEFKR